MATPDLTSLPFRRQYSEPLRGLSVRAANILHKVGVNLWLATREEALAGIDSALATPLRGCGVATHAELRRHRDLILGVDPNVTQLWAVTVTRNGDTLVTIDAGSLSGKPDLSDEDKRVIRLAADHLFSFVGPVEGWSPFIVPDDEGEPGNMGQM
jgi:hypothetical protein